MEWMVTELMGDRSEVIRYDRAGLPLYIRAGDLSHFPGMRAPCHWHDDVELIRIVSGYMRYHVNGQEILLGPDDCVVVNSRQMHFGYDFQKRDCRYSCILFHPSLLSGGTILEQDFVLPVLEMPEYWLLRSGTEAGSRAAECAGRIMALKAGGEPAFELEVIGLLHILWAALWRNADAIPPSRRGLRDPDIAAQKAMASCIYRHYGERLSLNDIAAAGHVSRSKCCQIFRRFMGQSPVEYLNSYRLKRCRDLLIETEMSVTEIALSCGFNHLSYFSRMFLRTYGDTPSGYRAGKNGGAQELPSRHFRHCDEDV